MRIETVTCDGCGADLTVTSNMVDYRLLLASENKPGYGGGAYTAMGKYPAIGRDHHFCNLECMDHWRSREKRYASLFESKLDGWIGEKGTRTERSSSFPEPPPEIRKAWKDECRAAADAEFPMKHKG